MAHQKPDGPAGRDKAERNEDAAEAVEAAYFSIAAGIPPEQARLLIKQHGNHRATLMAAARRLKHT